MAHSSPSGSFDFRSETTYSDPSSSSNYGQSIEPAPNEDDLILPPARIHDANRESIYSLNSRRSSQFELYSLDKSHRVSTWSVNSAKRHSKHASRSSKLVSKPAELKNLADALAQDQPEEIVGAAEKPVSIWYAGKEGFRQSMLFDSAYDLSQYQDLEAAEPPSAAYAAPDEPDYAIQYLLKRDDKFQSSAKRRYSHMLTPLLSIGDQVTFWLYFIARVTATIQAQEYRQKAYPLSWIFLAVECLIAFPNILWEAWQLTGFKHRKRPMLRLVGDHVPTCDLFVTTCGEDVDQIMDTVRAACFMEYPVDRFRVVVLDDAKNDELRQCVETAATREFPNLYYYSRTKIPGQPHHFKAGNLNHGVAFCDALPGPFTGGGEFFAALDADMLCTNDMLRALLPHLLLNPKLAMSCPPQLFYNTPTDDPLYESLDYFVHVAEVLKDALGVAWCTGSGYCVRRAALDDIGGFPYGSLAEDVCFSSMLLGKGWQCAYVHEPLQWGTVPDSFEGHIKQRTRWIIGTIQTSIKLNFCLWGKACDKMTFFQRLCGCIYAVSSIFSVFLTLACLTVPIVLFSGGSMVAFVSVSQLKLLIRLCFINYAWRKVAEFFYYSPSGYWFGRRESAAAIWMAPYYSYCIIRSFVLPKWLGGKVMAFSATGAAKGGLNEWYKDERANVFKRIFVMVWHHNLWYHVMIILFTLGSVGYSSWQCTHQPDWEATVGCLILRPLWPPPSWIILTAAFFVPLHYMVFPPTCAKRQDLITYDEKGVASPKDSARKTIHTWRTVLGDLPSWICLIWSGCLFVGTWFLPDSILNYTGEFGQ